MLHTDSPHRALAPARRGRLGSDLEARLSICQTTTLRWALPDAVREYAAAGISGIGVSWESLRAYGRGPGTGLLRRSGLSVTSLGWVGGFTGDRGCVYDEAVDEARDAIDVARDIGAGSLVVVSGAQAGHIRPHARRLLVDALTELAGPAAEAGVRLALQPMHPLFQDEWSFLNGLDDTLSVLEEVDHSQVGMAFGAYHLWQQPRLIERIPEIARHIASVQISDWREPARCDNDRLLPGDGSIPLREIIAALEAARYAGAYEIEVWSRDLWKQDQRGLIRECRRRFLELAPQVV